ncbi:MAG: hypothetical protein GX916_11680 [Clostridiales bacterium]|jgi:hypothetical protein|nr:hypothetical protein [Clostridiales bacterium]
MIDIDRFTHTLDELTGALPAEVFKGLNLGVGVVDRAKRGHDTPGGAPVYILGEYHVHPVMGRGVVLYYGSFLRVFPHLDGEASWRREIDRVLKHELTHHLESQAGDRDLAIADAMQMMKNRRDEP